MKDCSKNGFNFVLYAAVVAFALAKGLEPEEQDILGEFLQAVGYNLSIIAYFCLDKEEKPLLTTPITTPERE